MVSPEGVRTIRASLLLKAASAFGPNGSAQEDARERLAIATNRLRFKPDRRAGRLPSSDLPPGMRYRRSEVDAAAATWAHDHRATRKSSAGAPG